MIQEELDFLYGKICLVALIDATVKLATSVKYNKNIKLIEFDIENLLIRKVDLGEESSEKTSLHQDEKSHSR